MTSNGCMKQLQDYTECASNYLAEQTYKNNEYSNNNLMSMPNNNSGCANNNLMSMPNNNSGCANNNLMNQSMDYSHNNANYFSDYYENNNLMNTNAYRGTTVVDNYIMDKSREIGSCANNYMEMINSPNNGFINNIIEPIYKLLHAKFCSPLSASNYVRHLIDMPDAVFMINKKLDYMGSITNTTSAFSWWLHIILILLLCIIIIYVIFDKVTNVKQ